MFPLQRILRHLRKAGPKSAWRKYRWRFAAVVFLYYLVRDLILYVGLPLATMAMMKG